MFPVSRHKYTQTLSWMKFLLILPDLVKEPLHYLMNKVFFSKHIK
jgi:hypothetical protein